MCWTLLQETDWLTGYFRLTRLCYSQRFEDVYNTLINDAETYFLPSNRASNIITLKAKVSPNNFRHKHNVIENYSQIRTKLSVLLSENKLYWIDWNIF